MKKIMIGFCLLAALLMAATLTAKEKYTVTILPFALHSAENIEYVRQGINDMLISRISGADKIDVTRKEVVSDVLKKTGGKELGLADVQDIGRQLNSDYVVWAALPRSEKASASTES